MNNLIKTILGTIAILAFQVLILNRLNISSYISPLVYPLILLAIPRDFNKTRLLLVSFTLGLLMDVFTNTGGAHATACLVLAMARPFFLATIGPTDSATESISPNIHNLGASKFAIYTLILLAFHHLVFFAIEAFTFSGVIATLSRFLISLSISWLLVIFHQFLFTSKSK